MDPRGPRKQLRTVPQSRSTGRGRESPRTNACCRFLLAGPPHSLHAAGKQRPKRSNDSNTIHQDWREGASLETSTALAAAVASWSPTLSPTTENASSRWPMADGTVSGRGTPLLLTLNPLPNALARTCHATRTGNGFIEEKRSHVGDVFRPDQSLDVLCSSTRLKRVREETL